MFPETLDGSRPTRGEERVFGVLRHALQPDGEFWAWYEPTLTHAKGGRFRPDFVVAGPGLGVLVLEVKDWSRDALAGGGPHQVRLRDGEGPGARHTHPEQQARTYTHHLRGMIERTPALTHGTGKHAGQSVLPVNCGVVLAGMRRSDLEELDRRGIPFNPAKVLTGDALDDGLANPRAFLDVLNRMRDVAFPFVWEPETRERLRAVIQPQLHFLDLRVEPAPTRIPVPSRGAFVPVPGFFLDRKQERMARGLASPRTLVYGPAGSGKTVFLVSRARYWLDMFPEARILFTCYNASLASHIRNEFTGRGVSAGDERLTTLHYHDLCRRMLGMGEDFHEKPPDFYALLEPRVLKRLAGDEEMPRYDLILVDEGQDFTARMLEVLVRLSAPGGEITVVSDPAQDLYGRWTEDALAPLGNVAVERLMDCYRNTEPIFDLALQVLSPGVRAAMGLDRLEMTRPGDVGRTGPPPEFVELSGLDALLELIVGLAAEFGRDGRPVSDLAVLYPGRHAIPRFGLQLKASGWESRGFVESTDPPELALGWQGTLLEETQRSPKDRTGIGHFAEALEHELKQRGVPCDWVARDFASKAAYDISRPRLTLSTIHSAKGMDYHTVVLLGADTLPLGRPERDPRAAALLFTGITRARERLIVPYFDAVGWVLLMQGRE